MTSRSGLRSSPERHREPLRGLARRLAILQRNGEVPLAERDKADARADAGHFARRRPHQDGEKLRTPLSRPRGAAGSEERAHLREESLQQVAPDTMSMDTTKGSADAEHPTVPGGY